MTTSQGCVGLRGRRWLTTTALAASGLCLVASGTRPALACHISHHKKSSTAESATATPSTTAAASASATPSLQAIMKDLDDRAKAAMHPVVTPTSATVPVATPEAQVLAPGAPTPATSPMPTTAAMPMPTPTPMPTPVPTSGATSMHMPVPMPTTITPTTTMPSVQDWHQTTASSCMPPPPTCSGSMSPTAATQASGSPTPLNAPASLLNPPTPAPEPSTIVTAFALAGAFAWRRRATRPRA